MALVKKKNVYIDFENIKTILNKSDIVFLLELQSDQVLTLAYAQDVSYKGLQVYSSPKEFYSKYENNYTAIEFLFVDSNTIELVTLHPTLQQMNLFKALECSIDDKKQQNIFELIKSEYNKYDKDVVGAVAMSMIAGLAMCMLLSFSLMLSLLSHPTSDPFAVLDTSMSENERYPKDITITCDKYSRDFTVLSIDGNNWQCTDDITIYVSENFCDIYKDGKLHVSLPTFEITEKE